MKKKFQTSTVTQGFLLIESLAAFLMCSLIIVPGVQLMSLSFKKAQYSYHKTCAMSLASMQLNLFLITQKNKKNTDFLTQGKQMFCDKNYRWEITKALNGTKEFALYTIKIYLDSSDEVEAASYVILAQ